MHCFPQDDKDTQKTVESVMQPGGGYDCRGFNHILSYPVVNYYLYSPIPQIIIYLKGLYNAVMVNIVLDRSQKFDKQLGKF